MDDPRPLPADSDPPFVRMSSDEDYRTTVAVWQTLTDVRFRLLAIVPTVAGAAVGLLDKTASPERTLAVGVLGLAATVGVVAYDTRNSQLYNAAVNRAVVLEQLARFPDAAELKHGQPAGGVFSERPPRPPVSAFGVPVSHGSGTSVVYAAALGAWGFLILLGTLLWGVSTADPDRIELVAGVAAVGLAVAAYRRLRRLDAAVGLQSSEPFHRARGSVAGP